VIEDVYGVSGLEVEHYLLKRNAAFLLEETVLLYIPVEGFHRTTKFTALT
jgi:hypothetical protein